MKLIVHYVPDHAQRAVADGCVKSQAAGYVQAYLQERQWDPSAPDYVVCTSTFFVVDHIRKLAKERNIAPHNLDFRWNGTPICDKMNHPLLENT